MSAVANLATTARIACLAVLASGCKPTPAAPAEAPASANPPTLLETDPDAAAAEFRRLEDRLLAEPVIEGNFEVTATGALEVSLAGEIGFLPEPGRLVAEGSFAGQPTEVSYRADGTGLTWVSTSEQTINHPTAAESSRAIAIGFTRMGVLHNLAQLVAGELPDHATGGVDEWVRVVDVQFAEGRPGAQTALAFSIVVDGRPAATATLWLDDETKLPVAREQQVELDSGSMRVVEKYTLASSS